MTLTLHCDRLFDGWQLQSNAHLHLHHGRVQADSTDTTGTRTLHIPAPYYVSPGLVDIQVNGGGGFLFNDAPSVQTLQSICLAHARCGTTTLLPTLITDQLCQIDHAIAAVAQAIQQGMPGVAGIHLEGPFLSPARKGVHQAKWMLGAEALDARRLTALGSLGKTLITLAPECVSAHHIRRLTEVGALVFAGHTNSDDATFSQALTAGVCGVTHLFNAMSQLGPRQLGVVGATLLHEHVWAGVILDGHHVAPGCFEFVKRMGRLERTILVSDAMPVAASPLTSFELQGQTIHVQDGRCVTSDGVLAGASVTLSDCVRIGIEQFGLTLEQALAGASRLPATLLERLDRKGHLRAGADADLVVWDSDHHVVGVMQQGQWLHLHQDLASSLHQERA